MASPSSIHISEATSLRTALEALSESPLEGLKPKEKLGDWFKRWNSNFVDDEARLKALALHDLINLLQQHFPLPHQALQAQTYLKDLLPVRGKRRAWDAIRKESEWVLPAMGLPAWAQTILGMVFMAGFVLPFIWPLWGSLILPVSIPLSLILEKRSTWLAYPKLIDLAKRSVVLSKDAMELGKFMPEDLERVFYELACQAMGTSLPTSGWQNIAMLPDTGNVVD